MILVLAAGDFGKRVAAHFPEAITIDVTRGTHPAAWPNVDLYILAAEYDLPTLTETLDASAFAWRKPWFPVLLDHPYLRCGPVVRPGFTACHQCFARRRRQHAKNPELFSQVQPPSLPGTATAIRGYATPHVTLAAGLARQAIKDVHEQAPTASVRTISLVDNSVAKADVVPVDACPRCRTRPDALAAIRELAMELGSARASHQKCGQVSHG